MSARINVGWADNQTGAPILELGGSPGSLHEEHQEGINNIYCLLRNQSAVRMVDQMRMNAGNA